MSIKLHMYIDMTDMKQGRWVVFWYVVALKRAGWIENKGKRWCLAAETVESAALSLEGVDNVHGSDGLSLGVLCVGDSITDDILKEHLQHSTGLFVDEPRDTLDSATAGQTTDSWLGDALDVVTKDLPVTLGASLSETFASLATSRHSDELLRSVSALEIQKQWWKAPSLFKIYRWVCAPILPDPIVGMNSRMLWDLIRSRKHDLETAPVVWRSLPNNILHTVKVVSTEYI